MAWAARRMSSLLELLTGQILSTLLSSGLVDLTSLSTFLSQTTDPGWPSSSPTSGRVQCPSWLIFPT